MYTTIKLPDELVRKIDAFIDSSDDGYTSRTDVVKTAVRDFFVNRGFNNNSEEVLEDVD